MVGRVYQWSFPTPAYDWRSFQEQPSALTISGPVTSTTRDSDGDGLGDALAINVPVMVNKAGVYVLHVDSPALFLPGVTDPAPPPLAPVVINELLSNTDPPSVDAVELRNSTTNPVNISGWFLTDDGAEPKKFRIPGNTILAPGGFAVFTETNFNPMPGVPPSFSLSSLGESVYLFSGDPVTTNLTGYSHSFDFGPAANFRSRGSSRR